MIKLENLTARAKTKIARRLLIEGGSELCAIAKRHGIGFRVDFLDPIDELPEGWQTVEGVDEKSLDIWIC